MNEGIDIAFGAAKLAAKDNRTASIVVHGLSAGYNAGQIGYYRYRLADVVSLFVIGFAGYSGR